MTMEQKINWMHYLVGGIFSIILLSINTSCSQEETDCSVISEFLYINKSEFQLETPIGIILPNSELSMKYSDIGSCKLEAKDYLPPFRDILTIKIGNSCKIYNSTSLTVGEGPLVISNYQSEKISDNNFKFTYTFKEDEFENLKECN